MMGDGVAGFLLKMGERQGTFFEIKNGRAGSSF